MNQALPNEVVIALYFVVSIAYLVVSLFVLLMMSRVENKLIMLGIASAVAAMAYSGLHATGAQTVAAGVGMPAILLRIAVVLILAGIAVIFLGPPVRGVPVPPVEGPGR
jgi:hypothetical protein